MKAAKHLHIEGRVQGVGFRYEMEAEARQLGLTGWVRNRDDGSVEAVVYGNIRGIEDIIAWAKHGPRLAKVTRLQVSEAEDPGSDSFVILPTR